MSLKLGGTGLNGNKHKCIICIHGHWKNQNPGGLFGATSQTALQIQSIWPIFLVDRLNWHCCLAGSSKTAPRILIFSMAMGVDYTFELISIKTCAPQLKWHNKSFLGSVCIYVLASLKTISPLSSQNLLILIFIHSSMQGQLQIWTERHSRTDLWKSETSGEIKKLFEHLWKLYWVSNLEGRGSKIKPATPILVLKYKCSCKWFDFSSVFSFSKII